MYSSIVVGVDGQAGGRDAAALAATLSAPGTQLAVVHVCVTDPVQTRAASGAFDLIVAEQGLDLVERERDLWGHEAEAIRAVAKSVGAGLEQVAAERNADLIVVGSCHRRMLGRVLAGDDAASVLHHARRAVAVAPAGFASRPQEIRHIGLAYAPTPESKVAYDHATALADQVGGDVLVRMVVSPAVTAIPVGSGVGYMEDPEALVEQARTQLGELANVTGDVVVGPTHLELAAFSEQVDLLVCGSRHNGPVRRVALGSTSDYLAHHARCPLLVTPTAHAKGAPTNNQSRTATV